MDRHIEARTTRHFPHVLDLRRIHFEDEGTGHAKPLTGIGNDDPQVIEAVDT